MNCPVKKNMIRILFFKNRVIRGFLKPRNSRDDHRKLTPDDRSFLDKIFKEDTETLFQQLGTRLNW